MTKSVSMNNLSQDEHPQDASNNNNNNNNNNSTNSKNSRAAGYASSDDAVSLNSGKHRNSERKRAVPWTEEEHRQFLFGLQKVGKGDWGGISRSYVVTRTPTQVANHAQKYFLRRSNLNRRRRRSSIFDITTDTDKIFDVFLSFRGEDTRASFTSHLCSSLQDAGIFVFKDDDGIPRGDCISIALQQGIKKSLISIVVLSRNYASSKWCLQELDQIMECRKTIGQVVVPVFYGVDPSEVRHQTGKFGEAFEDLVKEKSTGEDNLELIWRTALREVGGIAGFVIINPRNESEDIKNVVQHVTRLLDRTDLFVAGHPVGVESRVQEVIKLLNHQQSKDVLLLGIWGMGGIGKTTIVKAVYNQIGRNFEGRSFLANVREAWEQDTSRVSLQERVFSDIYKTMTKKIDSIESGKSLLKEKLSQRSVLLVLDDVNTLDQLNALCGSHEWFGPGSRIIITTRDMHLLRARRADHVYRIKEMDNSEALKLFCWHAFKQENPKEDLAALSRNVVAYSGGLPLALEVLGSYLFDRGITEWKSVLEKLKRIPNDQVQKKLRISFDGLSDDTEKEIFLDIACFFIGMDRNDATHILNGSGLFAEIGVSVLLDRSLINVDNKNKLRMHDLLRDMGREIIRDKSPYEPEERSRLWHKEDVIDVISRDSGTKAVKGLALKLSGMNTTCLNTKAFKKMNRLRLLQLCGVKLTGDFKYLSRDLRWLCWQGFPSTYMPADFHLGSLVALVLKYSNFKLVWKNAQMMENLKYINLSHSHYLTQTPDFSYLPNIEKLVLKDCPNLFVVSNTIGQLNQLLLINLKDCKGLRKLPRSIYKLKSLKTLILSGCLMIDKLEEDLEQMESLTTLIADKTAITKVPFSVVRSKSIGYISMCGYEGFSDDVFPSIISSWMSPTNNLLSLVQTSAGMPSLVSLHLPNSSSHGVSSIFTDLPKLQSLRVECGLELQLTRDVACKELEASATTPQVSNMKTSSLIDCRSQVQISELKNPLKSFLIQMGMNCQVTNILKESILQKLTIGDFLLPSDNYPDWLTFNYEGCSVIFEVSQVIGRKLKAMMLCIVYTSTSNIITSEDFTVLIINYTRTTTQIYKRDTLISSEDREWQSIISNLEPGNKVEVVVVFGNSLIVKKTTVYLIYQPIDEKMERWHAKNVIVFYNDENVSTVHSIAPQVGSTDMTLDKKKKRKLE